MMMSREPIATARSIRKYVMDWPCRDCFGESKNSNQSVAMQDISDRACSSEPDGYSIKTEDIGMQYGYHQHHNLAQVNAN